MVDDIAAISLCIFKESKPANENQYIIQTTLCIRIVRAAYLLIIRPIQLGLQAADINRRQQAPQLKSFKQITD